MRTMQTNEKDSTEESFAMVRCTREKLHKRNEKKPENTKTSIHFGRIRKLS